jgi:hypothetical protein
MLWSALAQVTELLPDLLTARCQPESAKDLEIVLQRRQTWPLCWLPTSSAPAT